MNGKRKRRAEIRLYAPAAMAGRLPKKDAPPFGRRLAALRKERGLSQVELGKLLGVSVKLVDYYERRAKNPTVAVIKRAADALGVPTTELLATTASTVPVERGARPGPRSRLDVLVERVRALPRKDRDFLVRALEALLTDVERRLRDEK